MNSNQLNAILKERPNIKLMSFQMRPSLVMLRSEVIVGYPPFINNMLGAVNNYSQTTSSRKLTDKHSKTTDSQQIKKDEDLIGKSSGLTSLTEEANNDLKDCQRRNQSVDVKLKKDKK